MARLYMGISKYDRDMNNRTTRAISETELKKYKKYFRGVKI